MSSDDPIRRGDAIDHLHVSQDRCMCGSKNVAILAALPADPVAAAAVRLAEAVDAMEDECCAAGIPQYLHANRWTDSEASFIRMLSALAAYRAAKHAEPAEPRAPSEKVPTISDNTDRPYATMSELRRGWDARDAAKAKEPAKPEIGSNTTRAYRVALSRGERVKCANPDCLDGYVPSQPDGEPEPCPTCRGGAA